MPDLNEYLAAFLDRERREVNCLLRCSKVFAHNYFTGGGQDLDLLLSGEARSTTPITRPGYQCHVFGHQAYNC
ncbi:MAG: hypothetical protein ACPGUX_03485 [Halocynthiibacter sp.]